MFLLIEIDVWEWDFNRKEQITEDDYSCDESNKSDDETVDSDLFSWFKKEDKNWWSLHSVLKESDWLNKLELLINWNEIHVKNAEWFDKELEFSLK